MADFFLMSTVATQSGLRAAPFACSDAREYLKQAMLLSEHTLKIMEEHQNLLPYDFVHQWRADHNEQISTRSDLVTDLNRFDKLSIMEKVLKIGLRRRITHLAHEHIIACKNSWMLTQEATSEIRSQLVSRCARHNEASRNGREYGTFTMDMPKIPVHDTPTPTPTSTSDTLSRRPGGTIPKNRIASRQTLSAPPEVTP